MLTLESRDDTLELMSIQHEILLSMAGDLNLEDSIRRYMETCLRRLSLRSVHLYLFIEGVEAVFDKAPDDFQGGKYFNLPRSGTTLPHDLHAIYQQLSLWRRMGVNTCLPVIHQEGDEYYYLFPLSHGGVLILNRIDIPLPDDVVQAMSPIVERLQSNCELVIQHRKVISEVELRTQAEEKLQYIAFHDELTGLPNRLFLISQIEAAVRDASQGGWDGALVYIDIDNFRDINDSLGHSTGDQLLTLIGERLSNSLRGDEVIARLGSDEFALLIPRLSFGESSLVDAVDALRELLKEPFHTQARPLHVVASFGMTLFPSEDNDALAILRQGDLAMSIVKRQGRNGSQFYKPEMMREAGRRFRLDADMREALTRKQFELYLQPQVHSNGCIFGAECLIRWRHPELGFVSPQDFISIAEKTGFIVAMGEWILREACHHIRALRQREESRLWRIAVNISAKQFHQKHFVEQVESILAEFEIPGCCLELELTESTLLNNVELAIEKMARLQALGVQISIDDFGTGYSSLMYLKKLPVNKVKIDQSFVRNIHKSPDDATIVEAIMAMAGRFGLDVIAEGVETKEELDFLSNLGCREFQGYYFHKPMPLQHILDVASLSVAL